MAKAKAQKDYLGLDRVVSIILAIIPFTAWILGIITRAKEGKWIATIIRVVPFFGLLIWVVDLVMMVTNGSIWRLLDM